MSMSLQWKMHTKFPFSRVFVLGVILFFLGLASMIISIISFVTQSWGHYVGTGMWGGTTVLASGITAVFVSRVRSLASVKTFCICSMVALFTSLTVLILSAGGLTLNSGFYSRIDLADYNKRTSNLIHASLLVISVFCLSGSVLAVIVCSKYLFFEHYDKPKRRRHHRNMSDSTVRATSTLRGGGSNHNNQRSASGRTPTHTSEHISRRHSDIVDVNRVQIEYRRSHKRSVSDQPHAISHSRRQKHGHLNISHGPDSSNTNLLCHTSVRYYTDRRSGNNRSSGQGIEVRGNCRETDRHQNIVTSRQGSNRPVSLIHMQPTQSSSPTSASPKVRLPTEFNEEELPPYEAVETSANAMNSPHSDSGDESDTENSSSTDAHSYIAHDEEGMETVPMVQIQEIQNQESCFSDDNSRQYKTTNFTSFDDHTRDRQSCAVLPVSGHTEAVVNNASFGAVIMRNDQNSQNRSMLSYINSQQLDQGDSEHLLSVSPEVCAITGESPELSQQHDECFPHIVKENFYENGPCYENVRCGGNHVSETSMNHLSKSSSTNLTEITNVRTSTIDKETNRKSSAKVVPVQVITHSSPVSNTSPQSPLGTFGSTLSAFRPVGSASLALSPGGVFSSTTHSPPLHSNIDGYSPQNDITDVCCGNQNSSRYIDVHTTKRNYDISSGSTSKYIEQGAKPKAVKHRENLCCGNSSVNMSWKNIPLPLSYNHSESASNESEKKLPSKTIPLADSDPDISMPLFKDESPSKLSPRVYPSKNRMSSSMPITSSAAAAPMSSTLPGSPFGAAAEALLAASTKWNTNNISESAETHLQKVQPSTVTVLSNTSVSSVREASTQVSSGSTSHWHSHRMGGNQSLLQSRREELHNCQLSSRTVEGTNRAARPTSMPPSGGMGSVSHGILGLAVDRQARNRSSEASSFIACHQRQSQQPQSLALRQNHLLQHYPLQPQQPRLGVQLHQRRQQQHQLQQNIESQQHHQQMQQQQQLLQQPQPGNQQNVQAQQTRNGRPLFSVLL